MGFSFSCFAEQDLWKLQYREIGQAGHGNAWPVIMNGRLICQASVIFFSGCLMKSRDAIEFQAFGWDAPDHFNDLFGLSLKSTLLDCEMHSLPGDAQFLRRFGDCVSLLGCFLGYMCLR